MHPSGWLKGKRLLLTRSADEDIEPEENSNAHTLLMRHQLPSR